MLLGDNRLESWMLTFETLSLAYFAALAAGLLIVPGPRRARLAASAAAAITALIVLAAAWWLPFGGRAWIGHLYLVLGYWIPAVPAVRGSVSRFERWLIASDEAWLPYLEGLPRGLVLGGEAAYLMCYPMVPAAFVIVWMLGDSGDVDRFWLATLGAGFLCYVTTPWLAARPPRLLSTALRSDLRLARVNTALLHRVSHNLTTFPSGHVAVATTLAFSIAPVSAAAAAAFAILAAGIALGAAAGRYHYVVDVLAGLVVGVAMSLLALTVMPVQ